jgi:mRNA deadenylase 3'-5' endonuclease subunit Ccr4
MEMEETPQFVNRSWIPKPGIHDITGPLADNTMLRVMTYNILADGFIQTGEYTYCPPGMRFMSGRHHRILQEVVFVNPDVLCLQEVSWPHFEEHLEPDLYELGYEGVHTSYKDWNKDGLAIFYKTDRLHMIEQKNCPALGNMEKYLEKYAKGISESDRAAILHLAERSQGCLLAKFWHYASQKTISIGNIHIKWTMFSLPGLACFEAASAVNTLKKFSDDDSFILMGDYNSTPDYAPYTLTNVGAIDVNSLDWRRWPEFEVYPWDGDNFSTPNTTYSVPWRDINTKPVSAQERNADLKLMKLLAKDIQTHKPLKSAYCAVLGKEPEVTNCEAYAWPGFVHELCLDYIWYTRDSLVLQNVLETPSREVIRQQHGLPSTFFPSDHISLAAIFKLL